MALSTTDSRRPSYEACFETAGDNDLSAILSYIFTLDDTKTLIQPPKLKREKSIAIRREKSTGLQREKSVGPRSEHRVRKATRTRSTKATRSPKIQPVQASKPVQLSPSGMSQSSRASQMPRRKQVRSSIMIQPPSSGPEQPFFSQLTQSPESVRPLNVTKLPKSIPTSKATQPTPVKSKRPVPANLSEVPKRAQSPASYQLFPSPSEKSPGARPVRSPKKVPSPLQTPPKLSEFPQPPSPLPSPKRTPPPAPLSPTSKRQERLSQFKSLHPPDLPSPPPPLKPVRASLPSVTQQKAPTKSSKPRQSSRNPARRPSLERLGSSKLEKLSEPVQSQPLQTVQSEEPVWWSKKTQVKSKAKTVHSSSAESLSPSQPARSYTSIVATPRPLKRQPQPSKSPDSATFKRENSSEATLVEPGSESPEDEFPFLRYPAPPPPLVTRRSNQRGSRNSRNSRTAPRNLRRQTQESDTLPMPMRSQDSFPRTIRSQDSLARTTRSQDSLARTIRSRENLSRRQNMSRSSSIYSSGSPLGRGSAQSVASAETTISEVVKMYTDLPDSITTGEGSPVEFVQPNAYRDTIAPLLNKRFTGAERLTSISTPDLPIPPVPSRLSTKPRSKEVPRSSFKAVPNLLELSRFLRRTKMISMLPPNPAEYSHPNLTEDNSGPSAPSSAPSSVPTSAPSSAPTSAPTSPPSTPPTRTQSWVSESYDMESNSHHKIFSYLPGMNTRDSAMPAKTNRDIRSSSAGQIRQSMRFSRSEEYLPRNSLRNSSSKPMLPTQMEEEEVSFPAHVQDTTDQSNRYSSSSSVSTGSFVVSTGVRQTIRPIARDTIYRPVERREKDGAMTASEAKRALDGNTWAGPPIPANPPRESLRSGMDTMFTNHSSPALNGGRPIPPRPRRPENAATIPWTAIQQHCDEIYVPISKRQPQEPRVQEYIPQPVKQSQEKPKGHRRNRFSGDQTQHGRKGSIIAVFQNAKSSLTQTPGERRREKLKESIVFVGPTPLVDMI